MHLTLFQELVAGLSLYASSELARSSLAARDLHGYVASPDVPPAATAPGRHTGSRPTGRTAQPSTRFLSRRGGTAGSAITRKSEAAGAACRNAATAPGRLWRDPLVCAVTWSASFRRTAAMSYRRCEVGPKFANDLVRWVSTASDEGRGRTSLDMLSHETVCQARAASLTPTHRAARAGTAVRAPERLARSRPRRG
jgi:hypothetical protein